MTWGSHCPQCGKEECGWVRGPICEGNAGPTADPMKRETAQWRAMLAILALCGAGAFAIIAANHAIDQQKADAYSRFNAEKETFENGYRAGRAEVQP